MFVVSVLIRVHRDAVTEFMPLMRANADISLAAEPGCRRFDVCVAPDDETRVFLYEIYDDAAAFDAHLDSAHFKAFDAAVAPMVAEKSVATYRLAPG